MPSLTFDLIPLLREALKDPTIQAEIKALVTVQDDTLLTAVEAAAFLSMTPDAVRQAARRGSIPYVKLGRRLRFRRSDLAAP